MRAAIAIALVATLAAPAYAQEPDSPEDDPCAMLPPDYDADERARGDLLDGTDAGVLRLAHPRLFGGVQLSGLGAVPRGAMLLELPIAAIRNRSTNLQALRVDLFGVWDGEATASVQLLAARVETQYACFPGRGPFVAPLEDVASARDSANPVACPCWCENRVLGYGLEVARIRLLPSHGLVTARLLELSGIANLLASGRTQRAEVDYLRVRIGASAEVAFQSAISPTRGTLRGLVGAEFGLGTSDRLFRVRARGTFRPALAAAGGGPDPLSDYNVEASLEVVFSAVATGDVIVTPTLRADLAFNSVAWNSVDLMSVPDAQFSFLGIAGFGVHWDADIPLG